MTRRVHPGRARSAVLAGILGDVWTEAFASSRARQPPLFPTPPRLSDDTWLALATCEAIVRDGGLTTAEQVATVFLEWFRAGRLTGGGSSGRALLALAAGARWSTAGAEGDSDDAGPALRMAPLALLADPRRPGDRRVLLDIAHITHHGDEAAAAALGGALAIRYCLESDGVPPDLPSMVAEQLPESDVRLGLLYARRAASPPREGGDEPPGHAAFVLQAALLAAVRSTDGDIERALMDASSAGDHAGRVAILTAQIMGAAGCALPSALLAAIPQRDAVEAVLEPFALAATGVLS